MKSIEHPRLQLISQLSLAHFHHSNGQHGREHREQCWRKLSSVNELLLCFMSDLLSNRPRAAGTYESTMAVR
jgi:hypothetical protein